MIIPCTKKEIDLTSQGKIVIGVDEVGRGPLAGPVVAAAAWVKPEYFEKDFKLKKFIRDSKTVSEKKRNEVFDFIDKNKDFKIGLGQVEPKTIDRINILNASLLAMRLATEELLPQIKKGKLKNKEVVLVDGNKIIPGLKCFQEAINKGDQKIFSIAIASIYAKVFRDRIMLKYHKKYPNYGFDCHKGYGTKKHLEALLKDGFCEIHRQSFQPVKRLV
jgi:ribonuclease HII